MNRQRREDELRNLLTTQRGEEEILEILEKQCGNRRRKPSSLGTMLVETILNYEFPPRSDQEPESAKAKSDAAPADRAGRCQVRGASRHGITRRMSGRQAATHGPVPRQGKRLLLVLSWGRERSGQGHQAR